MPRRVPRKPRPKKINVPKGYDSLWEYNIHQTVLKDWAHHFEAIKYINMATKSLNFYGTRGESLIHICENLLDRKK